MSQRATFGVVGGYGATGRAVASELLKSSDGDVLIGGRDAGRLKPAAGELGSRVSAARVDVLDARSLDDFCSQCSIVVNCGGPVMLLQDRVAQAAFRAQCHYVDPAGMSFVKELMAPHGREIADAGLSFVVSAGWMPGITELVPAYAYKQARGKMDSIESVSVYFSDSGKWSDNAMRDGVWYLRQQGLPKPGYFRKGQWVRMKMAEASRKVDLGDPIGARRFSIVSMAELNELGRRLTDCNFLTYSYLSGFRTAVDAMMIALLPLSEERKVRLLRGVFRRNRLPVAGFAAADVVGRSGGRSAVLKIRVTFDAGQDYWMNAVSLATVARMISEGKSVRAGVHFLFEAVDAGGVMGELRKAGVRQTESLEVSD